MASKLKALSPGQVKPVRPKVLIFGKSGHGKTWASIDFPRAYYIDTEGGATLPHYQEKLAAAGAVVMGVSEGALSLDTIIEQVRALATEKHDFKTLIIDSITKVFQHEIAEEHERIVNKGHKDEFGASKKPAVAKMRQLVSWISRLDMNVILIAHETAEWGKDSKGERTQIGYTFDAWEKLEYELDLCLQIFKQGNSRKARVRKSRLIGFPESEVIDWSAAEFARRYGQDVIEKDVDTLVLATTEQVKELHYLLDTFKVDEATRSKWLAAAKADDFSEMDTSAIEKCINFLKAKFQQPAA